MKTIIFSFLVLLLSLNISFSQSGWIQQNTGVTTHILSLSFPNATTGYACGWYGVILKTTNGGDNWNTLSCPYYSYQSIFFLNVSTGYAVGTNGTIIMTTNGGLNWNVQYSGTTNLLMLVNFPSSTTGYVVGYQGTILKTTNAGTNWLIYNSGTTGNLLSVKFLNTLTGYITGDNSKFLKTTDGGTSWLNLITGTTNNLDKISFLDVNTGYIPGTNGLILKTTNGGNNFITQSSGSSNYLISANFINTLTGYISGAPGIILKTTNGGTNYVSQIAPTTNELHWIYFINEFTGWSCGYNGTILKTTTGGNQILIPSVPVLASPANNSTNVSLTPTLIWNTSSNASYYRIELSTTPNFINITDSATINTTQYIVPNGKLNSTTTYFWRVKAFNTTSSSDWSSVWNFGTTAGPAAPTLLEPQNNSTQVSLTPTFQWSSVSGAINYTIQISTSMNFTTIVDSLTTTNLTYTIPSGRLNINTSYYWRVRTRNSFGTSSWSTVWTFSTLGTPSAPVLLLPTNGALGVSNVPLMDWNNSNGATTYKIVISQVSNFAVITDSATVTNSQYQVPSGKLQDFITYFWRVNARNSYGASAWSATWMFTVYPSSIKILTGNDPQTYNLYQNYPNPFNPTTIIKFSIPKSSDVSITIYDIKGSEIERIVKAVLPAGTFEYTWNATNKSSGIYFVRFSSKEYSEMKRMVLVK